MNLTEHLFYEGRGTALPATHVNQHVIFFKLLIKVFGDKNVSLNFGFLGLWAV